MGADRARAERCYREGARRHDARDFEAAVQLYRAAIDADPSLVPVRNDLAAALCTLGRFEEALPHADAAVRARPGHVMSMTNLLVCLRRLERLAEARSLLDDAVARGLDPRTDLATPYVFIAAEVYWLTEDPAAARALFEAVLDEQPDHFMSRVAAANCHWQVRQHGRALAHLKAALRIEPDSAVVCVMMALCYRRCGLDGMAVKYCRLARERDPGVDLGELAPLLD